LASSGDAPGNLFTFGGEYGVIREGSSGLYRMGGRVYDANTMQFLTRDAGLRPDPRSANPYRYGGQNPFRYVDPTGLQEGDVASEGSATGGLLSLENTGNGMGLLDSGTAAWGALEEGIDLSLDIPRLKVPGLGWTLFSGLEGEFNLPLLRELKALGITDRALDAAIVRSNVGPVFVSNPSGVRYVASPAAEHTLDALRSTRRAKWAGRVGLGASAISSMIDLHKLKTANDGLKGRVDAYIDAGLSTLDAHVKMLRTFHKEGLITAHEYLQRTRAAVEIFEERAVVGDYMYEAQAWANFNAIGTIGFGFLLPIPADWVAAPSAWLWTGARSTVGLGNQDNWQSIQMALGGQ
jgi:RHS repeat-associated protein